MAIESLEDLLLEEVRDLYDAEKQLVKALPKMAKAATDEDLRAAFQEHLEETKGQVARLEEVFENLETKPRGKPCKAMKGLVEEGQEVMEEDSLENLTDLALIGAAQRVEHYEMAAYGTARAFAEQLGQSEIVSLLEQTLKEEENADKKLTDISLRILETATDQSEDEEEEEEVEA